MYHVTAISLQISTITKHTVKSAGPLKEVVPPSVAPALFSSEDLPDIENIPALSDGEDYYQCSIPHSCYYRIAGNFRYPRVPKRKINPLDNRLLL